MALAARCTCPNARAKKRAIISALIALVMAALPYKNHAQYRQLEITSNSASPFFLILGDSLVKSSAKSQLFMDSITATSHRGWFVFSDEYVLHPIEFSTPEELLYSYQISRMDGKASMLFSGQTERKVALEPKPKPKAKNPAPAEEPEISLSELFNRCLKQGYTGVKGCSDALNPIEFNKEWSALKAQLFESQRMQAIQKKWLNRCLTVDQMKELLPLFEFDDTRLELIQLLSGSIFDPGRIKELRPLLTFESNKSKFDRWIKNDLKK